MSGQLVNEAIKSDKPLVTFALFAYNQEKYIREAVEGAFAQTYSPLQIILSDDCSPDKTFEIMEKMTTQYAGPHEILLNRNKQNRGFAGHINYVMSLARGELIVVAAGDDISVPDRVKKNVEFFMANGQPDSLFSDYFDIDADGSPIEYRIGLSSQEQTIKEFISNPLVLGAAHAWTRRIFSKFGSLRADVMCEDQVIPFRAYFMNPPRYIPHKLVHYRRVSRTFDYNKMFLQNYTRVKTSIDSYLEDLKSLDDENISLKIFLEDRLNDVNILLMFWKKGFFQALRLLPKMVYVLGPQRTAIELFRRVKSLRRSSSNIFA